MDRVIDVTSKFHHELIRHVSFGGNLNEYLSKYSGRSLISVPDFWIEGTLRALLEAMI